ncbi:hypothetical protein CRG98_034477 [Punica granatum]|uniref:Carboxypeptidase n=1 Tax=Punica granatum TaxID=22663 RepID=A0A2I0IN11_PUNGR|nr:hypothetical protein CRG98_034477 [Punica granatum]
MKLLSLACCIAFSLVLCVTAVRAAPAGSLITNLPGFEGRLPSQHHAGYVSINGKPTGKKNLFYYFVASQRNPSKDPVVLWLNGGPGCSSFDGFVYEHGPFNFQPGNSGGSFPILQLNPYSWSKVSNIIYLDSPCGVGLSYSDNPSNYVTGDIQTTSDTHAFLLKWFELYPEFQANPFYISGESYAGVYVPMLASEVIKAIEGNQQPSINFKGYLVGNGIADDVFDGNGLVPFAFGMGLISIDIFADCQATCQGKYYDPPNPTCEKNLRRVSQASVAGSWTICADRVDYTTEVDSMLPYHKNLTARGYRALIYSGDHDSVVPFTGTQAWTRSLGYKIVEQWRSWLSNEQVAGYLQAYDKNLTFLTIKGAGHMVPQYKPRESLDFFTRWLDGKPI